jgi:hypothetical protein
MGQVLVSWDGMGRCGVCKLMIEYAHDSTTRERDGRTDGRTDGLST